MNIETFFSKAHHGRNIKRLREMLGVKQDAIAFELNITQQSFSEMEQKEVIEEKMLEKIAAIMNIPIEAIKNMNEETTYNYINTFNNNDNAAYNFQTYNFNPVDKIIELYERLNKEKDEKIALYEKLLNDKKV